MWNEAKWVCWFAPFCEPPRDTCCSGTALILHDAEVLRDVLTVGAYHFFFFCGSRSRLFKNIPVCLRPQGRSPRCRGDCFSVMSVRSCFLTKKHLWALFSPKPPSLLLLDWREPQRGRAKTTQRASDRKAKKVEPPFFFSVKLHKYFYFWRGQLQGSLSLSPHKWEVVCTVCVQARRWVEKKKKESVLLM